ncbi:MAG: alpha/beta fold hydrolase, partial [Hyphomicrobiaceae bacterium]
MPAINASVENRRIAETDVSVTLDPDKPLMIMTRMASRGMGLWDTIWDPLAERYSLVSFDLRMPTSEELDNPADVFRSYAAQCAAISGELGYQGYHVFGWNGGSHVALQCAADDPDNVRSCILVGAFFRLPDMRRAEAGVEFMRVVFQNPDRKLYALYWLMAGLSQAFVEKNFDQIEDWAEARVGGDRFVNQDNDRVTKWVRALRNHWVDEERLESIKTPM